MVAADARTAITFSLSPGEENDAAHGRDLLKTMDRPAQPIHLIMDRAYEGNETRQLALDLGFIPVVPPKSNRVEPWEYNREMYKRRNRNRTAIPAAQRISSHLLQIRKTRRHVHSLYLLCPDH